jgi:prophage antirepressor-like protein
MKTRKRFEMENQDKQITVDCSQSTPTENITQLLLHSFQDHNITVYGTWDNPLFKSSEIGEMLDISQIRNTNTVLQEQYFLTEDGLYELLFISRKPLAKTFRRNVWTLLEKERLKIREESRIDILRQIATEREKMLMEQHKGKSGVYFLKHVFKRILFFGSSHEACIRSKAYKSKIGKNDIFLDKIIETPKYIKLESGLRKYENSTYIDLKGHEHTEVIEYKDKNEIDKIYKKTEKESKLIEPPQYSIDFEIEKEKTKQLTTQLELKKLELEILKFNSTPQIQELHKLEDIQEEITDDVDPKIEWIRKNLVQKDGLRISLQEICNSFKLGLNNNEKTIFKKCIEKEFRVECKKLKIQGKTILGFFGLDLV